MGTPQRTRHRQRTRESTRTMGRRANQTMGGGLGTPRRLNPLANLPNAATRKDRLLRRLHTRHRPGPLGTPSPETHMALRLRLQARGRARDAATRQARNTMYHFQPADLPQAAGPQQKSPRNHPARTLPVARQTRKPMQARNSGCSGRLRPAAPIDRTAHTLASIARPGGTRSPARRTTVVPPPGPPRGPASALQHLRDPQHFPASRSEGRAKPHACG